MINRLPVLDFQRNTAFVHFITFVVYASQRKVALSVMGLLNDVSEVPWGRVAVRGDHYDLSLQPYENFRSENGDTPLHRL